MSGDEADYIRRRLLHGEHEKAVFVRDEELRIYRARSAVARQMESKRDWSLAGVYWPTADPGAVVEDIKCTRREQRQLRRVMRNYDVRA